MPTNKPAAPAVPVAALDFQSLVTVAEVAARTRIPEGGWRWHLFHRESNGLAESGAVVRIGRKLLLDEAKALTWLATKARRESPADVERARRERQRLAPKRKARRAAEDAARDARKAAKAAKGEAG